MRPSDYLKKGWCQHAYARAESGCALPADDKGAVVWCVRGALFRAYEDDTISLNEHRDLVHALREPMRKRKEFFMLSEWNDDPRTTQEQVIERMLEAEAEVLDAA